MKLDTKVNLLLATAALFIAHAALTTFGSVRHAPPNTSNSMVQPVSHERLLYSINLEGWAHVVTDRDNIKGIAAQNGFQIGPNARGEIILEWELSLPGTILSVETWGQLHATLVVDGVVVGYASVRHEDEKFLGGPDKTIYDAYQRVFQNLYGLTPRRFRT